MARTTFRIEVIIDTDTAEAKALEEGKEPRTIARVRLQNDTSWINVAEGIVSVLEVVVASCKRVAANAGQKVRPAIPGKVADA
jgi:hypothetical protein